MCAARLRRPNRRGFRLPRYLTTSPATVPLPFRDDDGIVVVEVGPHRAKWKYAMQFNEVPEPLRSRLGPAATAGLLELLSMSHERERAALIDAMAGRFERRLGDECAALRVEMANLRADLRQEMSIQGAGLHQEIVSLGAELRQEMASQGAELRQEMARQGAELRQEMASQGAELRREMVNQGAELRREMTALWSGLRGEMQAQGGDLRSELAAGRSELLKWCFLFWIGQVVALGTLMAVMLRLAT